MGEATPMQPPVAQCHHVEGRVREMNIIFQKSSGKALLRATSPDTRKFMTRLIAEFGELEVRPIAQTSFGTMPFDEVRWMAEITDLASTYCSACGRGSMNRPAADLVVVREETAGSPDGNWSFFCSEHSPAGAGRDNGGSSRQTVGTRNDVLCGNCFTLVPASRVCGTCGEVTDEQ